MVETLDDSVILDNLSDLYSLIHRILPKRRAQLKRVCGAESFLATAAPKDRVKVEVEIFDMKNCNFACWLSRPWTPGSYRDGYVQLIY